jgi:pimeloyl-ACP methyl ester carboxylesterase
MTEPAIKQAGHLDIGGTSLEYRWWGPPPEDAPTLVLLHEGLGCVAIWRDFPARLAEATGCGVFAYSRQGYGGSSPCALPRPLSYLEDEARDVLPHVLDAIGVRRCVLIGHSDGGSIAGIYGGMFDDPRIAGIAMMAPHFFTEDVAITGIAEAKGLYESTDLREKLKRLHGDNVDCAFRGWSESWLNPAWREWDISRYLPRIAVPVLALQGIDDHYGTEAQIDIVVERCTAPAAPVTKVMIPNCGHAPHKEAPDETIEALVRFAKAVTAAQT